jgi:glycosyltransferase involved in cell wall biosynthesis
MRLSFLSNAPWAPTGYGAQMKLIGKRLLDLGHPLSIQAFYGHAGSPIDFGGIQIYGAVAHIFGMDVVRAHAENFKADVVISNMDAWVIEPSAFMDKKWVAWFPIDSEPIPPLVLEKVRQAFYRIIWTKFAAREMDKTGLDYDYVPYGVDTKVFTPINKQEARKTAGIRGDAFVVGIVAANKGFPCRKAFHQNIAAFAELRKKHDDAILYLHTLDGSRPNGDCIDLVTYIKSLGLVIGQDVIFADQYSYANGGYPETAMNTLYNCMDVHLLVSMGEGFGMPQLEAQAAGVPVICGDWTTMPELLFSGWKVERKDAEPFYTLQNTYQFLPHVDAIADKLEMAYQMRGNADYSERARAGAMQYDIDRVIAKYWVPALARIQEKIEYSKDDTAKIHLAGLRK